MLTLKRNIFKYRDKDGNMQDSDMLFEKNETDSTLTKPGIAADSKVVGEKLEQLSEQKVDHPSTGAVGQILEIETVDESGKPKTYKAVDKPTGGETSNNFYIGEIEPEAKYKNWLVVSSYSQSTEDDSENGDSGETEVTLSSISAEYTGGDVSVGTDVNTLTGIVVTAHYSDGTTEEVTDYTLSGTINVGDNLVTIVYKDLKTTITVTGVLKPTEAHALYLDDESNYILDPSSEIEIKLDELSEMEYDKVYLVGYSTNIYNHSATIKYYFTPSWGYYNAFSDLSNGITKYNHTATEGFVVYEIDLETVKTNFQERIDDGTVDQTKDTPQLRFGVTSAVNCKLLREYVD